MIRVIDVKVEKKSEPLEVINHSKPVLLIFLLIPLLLLSSDSAKAQISVFSLLFGYRMNGER
jgi:hypothetical protein